MAQENRMKKIKILKNIDFFLFKQADALIENSEFNKISEAYSSQEDKVQEIIKVILMVLSIGIPLLIIFIFFNINSAKRSQIQIKEDLIETANLLIQKKSLLTSEERRTLSAKYLDSQKGLKSTIKSSLSLISIESTKVQVSDFQSEDLEGLITKLSAKLSFKGLTSEGIMAFFNNLNAKLRIKMDEISIRKNEATNSLDGVMTIHYYSKEPPTNE